MAGDFGEMPWRRVKAGANASATSASISETCGPRASNTPASRSDLTAAGNRVRQKFCQVSCPRFAPVQNAQERCTGLYASAAHTCCREPSTTAGALFSFACNRLSRSRLLHPNRGRSHAEAVDLHRCTPRVAADPAHHIGREHVALAETCGMRQHNHRQRAKAHSFRHSHGSLSVRGGA